MAKEFEIKFTSEDEAVIQEIAQFIFSRSQDNINKSMPWGDDTRSASRKPTIISDTGMLMRSGKVPKKTGEMEWTIEYSSPYSEEVEWGCLPKKVSHAKIKKWAERKLRIPEKQSQVVASRIVKKIERVGIEPHPFIRPAIHEAQVKYNKSGII